MPNIAQFRAVDCPVLIGELPMWTASVSLDTVTSEVERHFLADPALPGIIVKAGGQPAWLLSRERLLTALSQPYGREVFIKRPLHEMIRSIDTAPLILPEATPIAAASRQAMSRPDTRRFEPLLVRCAQFTGLIDVPDLLTAQATLLEVTLKSKDELIGELQRTSEQLAAAREVAQHEAAHDPLTGLPNRKLFLEILQAAIAAGQAGALRDYAVMFIDLDRFKLVNDSLGHEAGNELLKEVAVRLGQLLRCQSAGPPRPQDTVARLSGDEFAVLLANIGRGGAEVEIARRLLDDLARPYKIHGVSFHLSASIGILTEVERYATTEAVLRDADIAMYQAKRRGKARAVAFEPGMRERVEQRVLIESSLREAIAGEDFVLHYQPIIDLRGGEVHGYEALVRWQRPQGLVYPGAFIDIAEETGLIVPLGNWVFRKACETAREIFDPARPVSISMNLSPLQFNQPELCETLAQLAAKAGLDPRRLTLEITERSAMGDPDRALRTLKELKAIGFKLAIDDFGTGHSSLSYLHRFPIDTLKIDRTFIADLGTSEASTKVVEAILALAKSMHIEVTAEGIETAFQHDWLRAAGCHFGQGFYFGPAVPEEDIIE